MDLLFHLLLPIMLLLLFGIKLQKWQFAILAFFSVLPDFDRTLLLSKQGFHSLVSISILLIVLFLISRKKEFKTIGNIVFLLATFGLFSHFLLDLGGPMSLFYPIDSNFYQIHLNLKSVSFFPHLNFSIEKVEPVSQGAGTVLSEQGFALIFLLTAIFVFKKATHSTCNKS